ncbi:hypothetical protein GJJ07_28135 [Klebsiella pneumoniae]|uniref:hypothetical protein n=1 Tax=Klebsiella pneumoniae TaxID=573 RepID=UPI00129EDE8C|nr:hypothetical protein [Klebsiella pneumoniae]MRJ89255.1 hypothetical protein [Klebsiella pneumoniae]
MFEFIGFLFLLLVCYVFIQMVAVRVFPEYGVRKAEERYRRNPSAENEDLLWRAREGANKRGNSSRLTQSFHFFMFEPIFSPVNALNQPI